MRTHRINVRKNAYFNLFHSLQILIIVMSILTFIHLLLYISKVKFTEAFLFIVNFIYSKIDINLALRQFTPSWFSGKNWGINTCNALSIIESTCSLTAAHHEAYTMHCTACT